MTLNELKKQVDRAIENANELNESPDDIAVSLQLSDSDGNDSWSSEGVELHYDGNMFASGCVLQAFNPESD